ncbi:DUF899 domain-containing protein [Labedaea rhizosphaerae]|uniref:Putative dithiol-disulfide oxidoreductase (DUF899 family) n=1 Tax=Labedaea rhizosphaerae TaxID=598644 RepID=A0A4R6SBB6_LABRH|nr:DUF899 family protein [Labedaea rhizosphaerae]TDP96286.1 putative dithiol-disulfide oxidoreductase (DUF899 family) [Labedaea rhizosphaerae]
MNRPEVVTPQQWQAAREELLVKEKELTHALDALAAERCRLPMVQLSTDHRFVAPDRTEVSLTDLFDGRRQLVIYHFMQSPDQDWVCAGCASFTDNLAGDQTHLNQRDTRFILMARAPQDELDVLLKRFGWTHPWYTAGQGFYDEMGLDDLFALTVLLRDGDEVFRTYATTRRGVDRLRTDFNLLDLTPYGRQEQWEDSPEGWPQTETMAWIQLRDEY